MAEPPASSPLELFPGIPLKEGERVLWQGRPGFGLDGLQRRRLWKGWWIGSLLLFMVGGPCTFPFIFLALKEVPEDPGGGLVMLSMILGGQVGLSFLLSGLFTLYLRLVAFLGGHPLSTCGVLLLGPLLVFLWVGAFWQKGVSGWTNLLWVWPFWALVGALAFCVLRILTLILQRLHTHYILTSQRAFEVFLKRRGGVLVWQVLISKGWQQVRTIRSPGVQGRAHIALGNGMGRRLFRFVEQAEEAVEDIRRALEDWGSSPQAEEQPPAPQGEEQEPP